jgi:hypothetical protein
MCKEGSVLDGSWAGWAFARISDLGAAYLHADNDTGVNDKSGLKVQEDGQMSKVEICRSREAIVKKMRSSGKEKKGGRDQTAVDVARDRDDG